MSEDQTLAEVDLAKSKTKNESNIKTSLDSSENIDNNEEIPLTDQLTDQLCHLNTSDDVIRKLTDGILMQFVPEQERTKKMLMDIIQSQSVLIETLEQENRKFTECQMLEEVAAIMDKAKIYHSKLVRIKKDMTQLQGKSTQLKKRALKLEQQRQKEALQREQLREAELERERKLTAKFVAKPT